MSGEAGDAVEGRSSDPRGGRGAGSTTPTLPGQRRARFTVRPARTAPVIGSIQERGEEDYGHTSGNWTTGEQPDSSTPEAARVCASDASSEARDEDGWERGGTVRDPEGVTGIYEVHSPRRHAGEDDVDPELPIIHKPSYRRFAAIPVNSLLLDQKASSWDALPGVPEASCQSPSGSPGQAQSSSPPGWSPGRETKYATISFSQPPRWVEDKNLTSSWDTWPGPSEGCPGRSGSSRRAQSDWPQGWSAGRETKYATISFNRMPSCHQKAPATIIFTRPSVWEQQHQAPKTKPGRIVSLAREKEAGDPPQPPAPPPRHEPPTQLPTAAQSSKALLLAGGAMMTIHENEELPATLSRVSPRRPRGNWESTPPWNTVPRQRFGPVEVTAGNQGEPEKPFLPFPRISADRKPLYREFAAIPSRYSQAGRRDERRSSGVSFV